MLKESIMPENRDEKHPLVLDEQPDNSQIAKDLEASLLKTLEKIIGSKVNLPEEIHANADMSKEVDKAVDSVKDNKDVEGLNEAAENAKTRMQLHGVEKKDTFVGKLQAGANEMIDTNPDLDEKQKESIRRWSNTVDLMANKENLLKEMYNNPIEFFKEVFDKENGLRMEDLQNLGKVGKSLKEGVEGAKAEGPEDEKGLTKALETFNDTVGYLHYRSSDLLNYIPGLPYKEYLSRFAKVVMGVAYNRDFTKQPPERLGKTYNPLHNFATGLKYFTSKLGYIAGDMDWKKMIEYFANGAQENVEK